ncbi:hypothetical protein TNCV_3941881 [Trichonephila clavipes]|uniref:Uncharacterized protein n=1 Tax=Trichonephila clavipes TaxID=2585209 RepID=A0A8X6VW47_TRICX|nr:hypothetical protein TNCV_3941881 [Trichonephila clavipes]
MEINGVNLLCMRDSGSSTDICAWSWINERIRLDEKPLDDVCYYLPLAKIKTRKEFFTKAAIKSDADNLYMLGNRTTELIESSEQGVQLVD